MYFVNVPRIRGKMAEKQITKSKMADLLGISRQTLGKYLRKPEDMPVMKCYEMGEILCDNKEEFGEIFFAEVLS